MADSSQDRTHPATPRRRQKAREDGQVARSRDLGHFAALAAGGALLLAAAPWAAAHLRHSLAAALTFDVRAVQNTGAMTDRLAELGSTMLWLALPLAALMGVVGIGVSVASGGWNWTVKPLQPKFAFLDPISGIGRLFSKQQLIDAAKGVLLTLILGVIGTLWLKAHVDEFVNLLAMPLPAAMAAAVESLLPGLGLLLLALAAFAAIDVPLQRWLLEERLKMTAQEVKQEHKEQEGSPEVKGKIRARMREVSRRRMLAAVPQADLVVMNPTHYAVALKYDDATMAAPRVVAKGADLLALRIRDTAQSARVPVLQAPVLARALYAHAELDREIPAVLFAAVAQVLAYVYQLRAALAGRAPQPGDLPELNVPQELDPHHTPVPDMEQYE